MMDADTLKSVGIATIGQRLNILKAVYMIKLAQNVPFEQDDYVPPSEVEGRSETQIRSPRAGYPPRLQVCHWQ